MSINPNQVQQELAKLNGQFADVANNVMKAQRNRFTTLSSQLGQEMNQVVAGFQALTEEIDIPELTRELESIALPTQELNALAEQLPGVVNRGVAMLRDNPIGIPEGAGKLLDTSFDQAPELVGVYGEAVASTMNNLIVTANTPKAMMSALNSVANIPFNEMEKMFNEVIPQLEELQGNVATMLKQVELDLPDIEEFQNVIKGYSKTINGLLNNGAVGLIANVALNANNVVEQALGSIVNDLTTIPNTLLGEVTGFIQSGAITEAAKLLEPFAKIPITEIENVLSGINVSASGLLQGPLAAGNAAVSIKFNPSITTTTSSTPLRSANSILQLLRNADRELTEMVFATATSARRLTQDDVPGWHIFIDLDGNIFQPTALNSTLESVKGIGGHAANSLGVIIETNRVLTSNFPDGVLINYSGNGTSRVQGQQVQSVRRLMKQFFLYNPLGQIINHSQIEGDFREVPGFNAVEFALNNFGDTFRQLVLPTQASADVNQLLSIAKEMKESISNMADGHTDEG